MSGINDAAVILTSLGPATVSFTAYGEDTSNAAEYTFSGKDIGAAAADRLVIVAITAAPNGTAGRTISDVTVGGASLSEIVAPVESDATPQVLCAIWAGLVPDGAAADVVVSFSGAMVNCSVDLFAAYGAAAAASDSGSDSGAAKSPLSDTGATCPAEGFIVAITAANDDPGRTVTWAGVTEDSDRVFETYYTHSAASKEFTAAQTGLTISATFSATPDEAAMCWAAFAPA